VISSKWGRSVVSAAELGSHRCDIAITRQWVSPGPAIFSTRLKSRIRNVKGSWSARSRARVVGELRSEGDPDVCHGGLLNGRVTDGTMAGYRAGDDRGVLPHPK
jgi:hypothetical protein